MKYTYQIAFNSSDYFDLTPGKNIEMDGFFESGTKIWREQISELYITKDQNSSIYDTLESWFEDPTEFESRIWVKELKNGAQNSLHWFGIKWGALDKELKTYSVQPDVYDLWSQYFEVAVDRQYTISGNNNAYRFYDTALYYVYIGVQSSSRRLIDQIRELVDVATDFTDTDVISSFINDDAFEDSSTVDDEYGVREDYVTEEQSYMDLAGAYWPVKMSIADFNEIMLLYNVTFFIDSNDKLRYEHIKFFTDKLIDNAVDYSSYIKSYDDKWSYEITTIPATEEITMRTEDDQDDNDFLGYPIIYSEIRNRIDAQTHEFTTSYFSDLEYYSDNSLTFRNVLYSSTRNNAYKWYDLTSLSSFTADKNYLTLEGGGGTEYVGSNDFVVNNTLVYPLTVDADVLVGSSEIILQLFDRSSGLAISDSVTISSVGVTNDTLTASATANDGYLRLTLDPGTSEFTGYVVLEQPNDGTINVPTILGLTSAAVRTNGAYSAANIFGFWWQDNRLSRDATYNGTPYAFNGTQYNLVRKEISIYYSGVINPLFGFNDGTRIAQIDSWKRNPETDFYKISLIYQEDE